jgi:anti-sigma regulatory factor (Ser/Thr protein kinase)
LKELTIDACVDSLPSVLAFVDAELEAADCPIETQIQIDLAIEEIFANIAHYAYGQECGKATLRVEVSTDPASAAFTFLDHGVPYDPLAKEDPDVTLPTKQRKIGGLGIFMTKQIMDEIFYEYRDGQNILTLKKRIV